ncbi:MAG: hypothetical protein PHH64_03120, partial [Proteiniphilum sp.]|nr:hypothetical protein [Proteiniphilum sp.]
MMKNTFTLLMIMLVSAQGFAQEIIPRPNDYNPQTGMVTIQREITISADNEFSNLIPGFMETTQKFSIHVRRKKKNGFIRLVQ